MATRRYYTAEEVLDYLEMDPESSSDSSEGHSGTDSSCNNLGGNTIVAVPIELVF